VAVQPDDEKSWLQSCQSLDIDIISLDLSSKLSFPLRFPNVGEAIRRGVRFEICIKPALASESIILAFLLRL